VGHRVAIAAEALEARLADYLRTNRDDYRKVRLGPRIGEGWSVDTYLVEAGTERLVLRLAGPDHPLRTDPAREARVMALAERAGIPVPPVVAAEEDPAWLGSPFSLVGFMEGDAPNVWSGKRMGALTAAAGPEKLLRQIVDLALAIPRVPVAAATARPPCILGMAAREYTIARDLERWRTLLDATSRIRRPLADAGEWLASNAPPDGNVVLQHHDFRLGNVLFEATDARATAVLDWEFAGAGDPLCDIGYAAQPYTLGRLLRRGPWLQLAPDPTTWVLREFRERSSRPLDEDRQRWFVALGIFKMAIALVMTADEWWRGHGSRRDAWLELPILSLMEDLVLAIRAQA
jgi:aminoglycoside phosphotransferase (APT) family kinase protein